MPTICNKTKAGGKSRTFKKKRFQFLPYVKAEVMANACCRLLKLCACYLSTKKRGERPQDNRNPSPLSIMPKPYASTSEGWQTVRIATQRQTSIQLLPIPQAWQ